MGVQEQLDAFAARLTALNDRNVMRRGMALPLEDPRDLRDRLESMCAAGVGQAPSVESATALGAVALALALACARVEELDVASGDEREQALREALRGRVVEAGRRELPSSIIEANRTKQHSAKPECFLDHIEASCPGPYLELFARRARFGWDYWGDESLGTAEMVA
jgi:hypothetical protein